MEVVSLVVDRIQRLCFGSIRLGRVLSRKQEAKVRTKKKAGQDARGINILK